MNAELSCSQCRDALVELTAGTLNPIARQAVERHLASCPDCQRERDNWLALGGAIRESGQRLAADGGFATGLVRLRAALALENDNLIPPEGEAQPMEPDTQPTDTRAPAALSDTGHPSGATPSRRRSYPAIAATLALALVSALVFGMFASRNQFGARNTATATATPSPTSATTTALQTVPPLAKDASGISISMVSATDGWAAVNTSYGDASSAVLLHYSSGRWTPSGDTYPGVHLSVSMDSHDDGWAIGSTQIGQITGVMLHYSNGHWSQIQTSNIPAGGSIWAFSPTQALVLTSLPKDKTGNSSRVLQRYDNGVWTKISGSSDINGMSPLSANDLWATSRDGHILHYHDGQWTTYTIAGQTSGQEGQPLSIGMLSDSEGWVGGFTNANPQGMFLAHFDGHTWTRVPGPAASSPVNLWAISAVSPAEGWAGGDLGVDPPQAVMLHYIHGQWQAATDSYSGFIGEIVMVSPTEGWATVHDGSNGAAGLLHYQNGRWTPYNPNS